MSMLSQIRDDLRGLSQNEDLSLEEFKKRLNDKVNELSREISNLSWSKNEEPKWGAPGSTDFRPGWGEMGG